MEYENELYGGSQWLIPNAWDAEWTELDGVILNDNPTVWSGAGALWENPCTTHTIPITPGAGGALAILTQNLQRDLLIIQNNSIATSPDEAPIFYISFGQLAQQGQGLGLPPGVGLVLDYSCPRDAVYLTIGPSVDTGDTVVVQGAVVEGAYSPPTPIPS
jgi:hypothetical protein